MNTTEIKTRHGLILQGLTAKALSKAGFSYEENFSYDEVCEVPDFLIPNGDKPEIMIEVHQTDARNSFQMKILRGYTAVNESKVHFGENLISVNILFGDPESEVPESNLKALCGYFDVNIIPRYHAKVGKLVAQLESISLELARTEDLKVVEAVDEAEIECEKCIEELSRLLNKSLSSATINHILTPIWQKERKRTKSLGSPPLPGPPTHYKRNILRSLFFTNEHFKELQIKGDPDGFSPGLAEQLVRCNLAVCEEQIQGDVLILDLEFEEFVRLPEASRFRYLCQKKLKRNDAMRCYIEDIRDTNRRCQMSNIYSEFCTKGCLEDAIKCNMEKDIFQKIKHGRTWLVDVLTIDLDISLNQLSRKIYTNFENPGRFGDPISHIAPRTERFLNLKSSDITIYAEEIVKACNNIAEELGLKLGERSNEYIERGILKLRLNGIIKLQKLNPIYLVLESICTELGLSFSYEGTRSVISDLAKAARSVAKFKLYHITDGSRKIIANAVAVHDNHGDDKSKEWGARRRALGYRMIDGIIRTAEFDEALFIIDGDWEPKHVERLYRSGWTRIVRLNEVEETLRDIFGIADAGLIQIPEEEPLPLAAERNEPLKIKNGNNSKRIEIPKRKRM